MQFRPVVTFSNDPEQGFGTPVYDRFRRVESLEARHAHTKLFLPSPFSEWLFGVVIFVIFACILLQIVFSFLSRSVRRRRIYLP
jgi:hypothetical protein